MKYTFQFILLIIVCSCAGIKTSCNKSFEYNQKIIGNWVSYSSFNSMNQVEQKKVNPQEFIFANDDLIVKNKVYKYWFNDDCSKIICEYSNNKMLYFEFLFKGSDTLILTRRALPHESTIIKFKRSK